MKKNYKNQLIGLGTLLSITMSLFAISRGLFCLDVTHLIATYPQIPQWAVSCLSTAVNAAGVVAFLAGIGLGGIGAAAGVFIRRYGMKVGISM
ncbi:MAG: hypothetical protein LBF32_04900 [Streptococcaceae bacterium]|jgi:hypothetical protein|nr:hypothetical protein [Streptococcaceae bacterium]